MFVDLMSDIHHTFTERFLRAQLVFNPQEFEATQPASAPREEAPRRPTKRYNALGILEDIVEEPPVTAGADSGSDNGVEAETVEATAAAPARSSNPLVVGAGRVRSLNEMAGGGAATGPLDFTGVGRNDPCPCGSGKKFKKCHGA